MEDEEDELGGAVRAAKGPAFSSYTVDELETRFRAAAVERADFLSLEHSMALVRALRYESYRPPHGSGFASGGQQEGRTGSGDQSTTSEAPGAAGVGASGREGRLSGSRLSGLSGDSSNGGQRQSREALPRVDETGVGGQDWVDAWELAGQRALFAALAAADLEHDW